MILKNVAKDDIFKLIEGVCYERWNKINFEA